MSDQNETPQREATSPRPAATKEDWILQQLNNQGREIGENSTKLAVMENQLKSMSDDIKENGKLLNRIQWTIAFASGVLLVVGFIVNLKAEQILDAFSKLQ